LPLRAGPPPRRAGRGRLRRRRPRARPRGGARPRPARDRRGVACYPRRAPRPHRGLRGRRRAVTDALALLRNRFELDERSLARALDSALERRVDHAELFFEHATRDSLVLEEGIAKSGDAHVEQGVGVRAQSGERQGYAHSDEVSVESLRIAAGAARAICEGAGGARAAALPAPGARARDPSPVRRAPTHLAAAAERARPGPHRRYPPRVGPR